ncbi:MAG: hypothetical protein UV60_C0015G0008 [Parcubacteria group bacterium GW2011_GWA2_43_11]|nr:MAG: hypothetical protein UV60_C0015G0008 [Parcubacteria group bacterium GW2011_GWA2_43_11]
MKAKQYAEALFLAARTKGDAELDSIASQFRLLLEKKGHLALLPAIVRELDKLFAQRNSGAEIVIRVAKLTDAETLRERIEADILTLNATHLEKRILVDETLIGGYEVRAYGQRIDRTYKRSLLTLYTNLITNNQ